MIYKEIGKSGIKASSVALGTWEMAGNVWGSVDDKDSIETIHAAVENGITLIDTAASYGAGKSEEVVGRGLEGIRKRAILSTKCGATFNPAKNALDIDLTPKAIRKEIEASMKRLCTDYIDLYFFHYPDPSTPLADSLGEMEKLRGEGKIRMIGLSNFDRAGLDEAMKHARIDCMQLKFSMITRDNEDLIHYCGEKGVGVMTHGSIAGGMLSGAYKTAPTFESGDRRTFFYPFFKEPMFSQCRKLVDELDEVAAGYGIETAAVAIQWVLAQSGVTAALVGANTPDIVLKNAKALNSLLPSQVFERINTKYKEIFG